MSKYIDTLNFDFNKSFILFKNITLYVIDIKTKVELIASIIRIS